MSIEEIIQDDLHRYLLQLGEIDERMPECPDIEGKWKEIAEAYLPDGVREFAAYPTVSLGWMMFVGMAMGHFWDADWESYDKVANLYLLLRDKRGFDTMDEYIVEDVLGLDQDQQTATSGLVAECASRTLSALRAEGIEPGTTDAFRAYVACLHQMYLFGAAIQLKRLGYHMTLIG